MTDSPDLTPEHDAVRRLLADARHDGSTPPEVVARLDETLAELVADRSTSTPTSIPTSDPTSGPTGDPSAAQPRAAAVVDLGARRRRLVGTGLLAAAAVVVAGVALGQVLPVGQGDDAGSSAGSADRSTSMAEDDAGAGSGATPEGDAGEDRSSGQELAPQSKSPNPAPLAGVPTLSSSDPALEAEVEALRSSSSYSARAQRRQALEMMRTCRVPELGEGRRVTAQVDGQPGVVLFQPPEGTAQGVAIYVCGTQQPVRTLTLPAP